MNVNDLSTKSACFPYLCEITRRYMISLASIHSTGCSNNTRLQGSFWASNSPVLMICSPIPIVGSFLVPDLCGLDWFQRFQEKCHRNSLRSWRMWGRCGRKCRMAVRRRPSRWTRTDPGEDRGTCLLCVGIEQYNTPPKKTRKPGLVLDLFTLGAKHWVFLDIK